MGRNYLVGNLQSRAERGRVLLISLSMCVVVGTGAPNVIESWDGTTWSVIANPDPNSVLLGLFCTSPIYCVAVGSSNNGSGLLQTLVETGPVAAVTNVTLAPTASTEPVGTSACETATVTDQNGNPVSGVDFTVTGANPNTGSANSADDGTAQYCYTGTVAGADTELAAVGSVGSNSATITWTTPQPTTLTTSLIGASPFGGSWLWWHGDVITVFPGTPVTDSATLGGANASTAGGTVTYTVYSDPWRKHAVASGGTVTVSGGVVPNSTSLTLPRGIYFWQASYSEDALNGASTSRIGSEIEIVVSAPRCSFQGLKNGNCGHFGGLGFGNGNGNH